MREVLLILFVLAAQSAAYVMLFNRVLMDATASRWRTFAIVVLAPLVVIVLPVGAIVALHVHGLLPDVVRFRGPPATVSTMGLYVTLVAAGTARFLWVSLIGQPRRPSPSFVAQAARSIHPYRPENPGEADRPAPGLLRTLDRWNDRFDLEVNRFALAPPGLPAAFDGFSIVHITDLHIARHEPQSWHEFVLETVERLRPDLVALTGDLFGTPRELDRVEAFLARLQAPHGVWAIRGNHDIWGAPEAILEIFARCGVSYLANRRVAIRRDGAALRLVGVEHPWDRAGPWRSLFSSAEAGERPSLTIVLTHTPDNARRIAPPGPTLVLAGHTHGGQIRLPVIGSLVVPSRYGKWFDQGWFAVNGLALYVNRGVGTHEPPIRVACRPEIAQFVLRCQS